VSARRVAVVEVGVMSSEEVYRFGVEDSLVGAVVSGFVATLISGM